MRIPQTKSQKIKAAIHAVQAVFVFIAGCLCLAVLTKDGTSGSPVSYFFMLCILTIPALFYQIVVPLWTRMWRIANVYAYAGCDLLFVVLWLAAACSVASWNAEGLRRGKIDGAERDGTCTTFLYGSASKCQVSKACVGFGTLIFFLFGASSTIAIQTVLQHRRSSPPPRINNQDELIRKRMSAKYFPEDDEEWSTNAEPTYARSASPSLEEKRSVEQLTQEFASSFSSRHSRTDSTSTSEGVHPGRPAFPAATHMAIDPTSYNENLPPSALSPTDSRQVYTSMNGAFMPQDREMRWPSR